MDATLKDGQNGVFNHETGVIGLNPNSDIETLRNVTSVHEVTHAMKTRDARAFNAFRRAVFNSDVFREYAEIKGSMEQWQNDLKDLY